VKHHLRTCIVAAMAAVVPFAGNVRVYANGIDLAVYTGRFNNLDQNAGSYTVWNVSYGDLPTPPYDSRYAPVEFNFFIPELTSYTWSSAGVPPWPAGDGGTQETCSSNPRECTGQSRTLFGPQFSQWYFVDVYYPGVQSFEFHFADPPAAGTLTPGRFSLIETNYLADNTLVGSPEGFSLTVNPDGTIQDVSVTDMSLSGTGIGGSSATPEPVTCVLLAFGFVAIAALVAARTRACRVETRLDACPRISKSAGRTY
jgi:hypothetical protein